MRALRDRRVAFTAFAAAAALWVWILASGGIVRHPPRKPDRAVDAPSAGVVPGDTRAEGSSSALASDDGERDPRARLAALEARLGALAAPALVLQGEPLERDLAAWHGARERAQLEAIAVREFGATGDSTLDAWLLEHPLDGTRVRAAQRIATFGSRVVREGDTLADGAGRVVRIEPAGVVITCRGRELLVPLRAASGPVTNSLGGLR